MYTSFNHDQYYVDCDWKEVDSISKDERQIKDE